MSTQPIVTKDSLQSMLDDTNTQKVIQVVGRALVALFARQTKDEQSTNDTKEHNNVGFAGCDAKSGSITAKYFIKHHSLEKWMVEKWIKKGTNNYSRLSKYHSQLNQIAISKSNK
jgi:hypothetical protein